MRILLNIMSGILIAFGVFVLIGSLAWEETDYVVLGMTAFLLVQAVATLFYINPKKEKPGY